MARRPALLAGIAVLAVVTVGAGTAMGASKTGVEPLQELAMLVTPHRALSTLRAQSQTVTAVPVSRPITGARTVLPVLAHAVAPNGGRWLRVMLPGRPNGSKGWIAQRGTVATTTRWRLAVRTGSRRLLVYREGRRVRAFGAVVGKPSTPTPHGQFFVEESVRMLPGSPGGPFALTLSARSNVFREFEGGPGQVGIHGVANLGGTMGTAVSHGCIRLANRNVSWLAARVPAGTVVTIAP
jgi:lipoprotein-anchoring transpeptidase ErfK/SrfK